MCWRYTHRHLILVGWQAKKKSMRSASANVNGHENCSNRKWCGIWLGKQKHSGMPRIRMCFATAKFSTYLVQVATLLTYGTSTTKAKL